MDDHLRPAGEDRLRAHVYAMLGAALRAVEPGDLVVRALGRPFRESAGLADSHPLRLLSVGKAAVAMARGALDALGPGSVRDGVVLAPEGASDPDFLPPAVRFLRGGHPFPSPSGERAAREILELLEASGPRDPVLALLSGGGSALLTLPSRGIRLDDLRVTTELLLRSGASIRELNAVRKHLERTKGGRLAAATFPAPVRVLALSDVIGDALDVIASGPFTPDRSTFADALGIIDRRGLGDHVPSRVLRHLREGALGRRPETPKAGDPCFDSVEVEVVGGLTTAAAAARAAARSLGYRTHLLSLSLAGEARHAGRRLGALVRAVDRGAVPGSPPICLVSGGETTVTVSGPGRGGRNQELALAAAAEIDGLPGVLLASLATDGIDGPTDAAGAIVTGSTLARAAMARSDPERALRDNDSHPFFAALGDLVVTGPTGTNVMDLQVILVE